MKVTKAEFKDDGTATISIDFPNEGDKSFHYWVNIKNGRIESIGGGSYTTFMIYGVGPIMVKHFNKIMEIEDTLIKTARDVAEAQERVKNMGVLK
jgi:hypothetical protein